MALELKKTEEGLPILTEDNKIIYLDGEKELPLDPVSMYQKISDLGVENKTHREKVAALKETVSLFEGIEDIGKYKSEADKALEHLKNWKDEDWTKVEKVEKLKREMKDSYEEKLKNKDLAIMDIEKQWGEKITKKDSQIRKLLTSSKFTGSKFFNGENPVTLLKPDMAEAFFGRNFKVEIDGDKTVLRAYYDDGSAVISKQNPGEHADFDEAMEFIIDKYPGKDSILRSKSGGSGGTGGSNDSQEKDTLTKLKEQYEEAKKNNNVPLMISLKGRISALQSG